MGILLTDEEIKDAAMRDCPIDQRLFKKWPVDKSERNIAKAQAYKIIKEVEKWLHDHEVYLPELPRYLKKEAGL